LGSNLQYNSTSDDLNKLERKSYKRWLSRLTESKTGVIGLIIILFVFFMALFAPFLSPYYPT